MTELVGQAQADAVTPREVIILSLCQGDGNSDLCCLRRGRFELRLITKSAVARTPD